MLLVRNTLIYILSFVSVLTMSLGLSGDNRHIPSTVEMSLGKSQVERSYSQKVLNELGDVSYTPSSDPSAKPSVISPTSVNKDSKNMTLEELFEQEETQIVSQESPKDKVAHQIDLFVEEDSASTVDSGSRKFSAGLGFGYRVFKDVSSIDPYLRLQYQVSSQPLFLSLDLMAHMFRDNTHLSQKTSGYTGALSLSYFLSESSSVTPSFGVSVGATQLKGDLSFLRHPITPQAGQSFLYLSLQPGLVFQASPHLKVYTELGLSYLSRTFSYVPRAFLMFDF